MSFNNIIQKLIKLYREEREKRKIQLNFMIFRNRIAVVFVIFVVVEVPSRTTTKITTTMTN